MFRRSSSLVSLMFLSGIVVRLFVQWAGMRKLIGTDDTSSSWPSSPNIRCNNRTISRSHADSSSVMMMMMMDLPPSLLLHSANFTNKEAEETAQVVEQQRIHLDGKRTEDPTAVSVQAPVESEILPQQRQPAKTKTINESRHSSNLTTTPSSRKSVRLKHAPTKRTDHAVAAYEYALSRARARVEKNANTSSSMFLLAENLGELYERETGRVLPSKRAVVKMRSFKLLNSIRIPKAASSALSVTARALVGCLPHGYPCCLDDVFGIDACPIANLYCPYVRGCVGHLPDYEFFADIVDFESSSLSSSPTMTLESTITVLRQPVARSLSAFFYKPPHRPDINKKCGYTWTCFVNDYLSNPVYSNPMTKMLVGNYAYDPDWLMLPDGTITSRNDIDGSTIINTYENVLQQAKDRLCRMQWFGIAEWPLASALLLYESHPFSKLRPNPVVFGLPPATNTTGRTSNDAANNTILSPPSSSLFASAEAAALRKNTMRAYQDFKNGVFLQGNGTQLLQRENRADVEIYDFALHVFCQRLQDTGLLSVRQAAAHVEELTASSVSLNHDDWSFFQGCTNLLNQKTKSSQSLHCPPRRRDDSTIMAAASVELI